MATFVALLEDVTLSYRFETWCNWRKCSLLPIKKIRHVHCDAELKGILLIH